jgi:CheY-like chemotaxis protein
MDKIKILWADDEIDMLKPQLLFLQQKGYEIVTVTNGYDALEELQLHGDIDLVFLDESMPGMTGLETLVKIKAKSPHLPVVMITKNEAEDVMEDALGSQISDYLIKPVNPNQVLLAIKKLTDNQRLVAEKTATTYQQEFRELGLQIASTSSYEEWIDIYRKLINWELRLDASPSVEMGDILQSQKADANSDFCRFISKKYLDWVDPNGKGGPTMSNTLLRHKVFPHLDPKEPTIVLLLDNLRFDQWRILEPVITTLFRIEEEETFCSILPSATQYSRNAIFAGLMPNEIERMYPQYWLNDIDEGGKNQFEGELLKEQIKRLFRREVKHDYIKITNAHHGKLLNDNILGYMNNELTVIVYNFIDMLSHARTEMEVLKELASDERAYRALTRSWFEHSPLWSALQKIADKPCKLIILTDHGTIRVQKASKVLGDRETTTNLRYKVGRNLQYEKKDVFEVREPKLAGLPRPNLSSSFIFAKEDTFFLYPNNYNQYHNFYRNTFQHGGISLEEMLCPVIRLRSKQ